MGINIDGFQDSVPVVPGATAFPNAVRDAPVDATVPVLMENVQHIVEEFLDLNREFAEAARDDTNAKLAILRAEGLKLPPELPDPPTPPNIITGFSANLGANFPQTADSVVGDITPQDPGPFVRTDVVIGSTDNGKPGPYTPLITGIAIPEPPTVNTVPEPNEPSIETELEIGAEPPEKDYGGQPDLLSISIPDYEARTLALFNEPVPRFTVTPPDPVIQWTEPTYLSDIKSQIETVLGVMLAGGTGIPEAVEEAIYGRARSREWREAALRIDELTSRWAAAGWDRPQPQVDLQIELVREASERKINGFSRDIAIEQANLEQKNRQFAVTASLDYERIYTALFLAVTDRNFQIAKFAVETQITIFNARVTAFNVEQQVYAQQIAKRRLDLDEIIADISVYKARVDAERAKADVNQALVAAFKARVDAYSAQVDAYKALVQAAGVRAELQKNKVDIYRAQIDAMVAKVNAQRNVFDAYESRVKGEIAKVGLEDANARVYATRVQAWGTEAEVVFKRAEVDLSNNKQMLDYNVANMTRITQYIGQQLDAMQKKLAVYNAATQRTVAEHNTELERHKADLGAQATISQINIARYNALIEQWKVRAQNVIQFGLAALEGIRASAQISATLTSGALAGMHTGASISAGANAGQTSSRSANNSTSQSSNVSSSNNYSVAHNYAHRGG